jgi:thioredoxin-like negative regulator of GroEL
MRWDMSAQTGNLGVLVDLARKATALRSGDAKHWETLAQSLLLMDKDEEAAAVLIDAIARLPAEPKLSLMLADTYYRLGRHDLFSQIMHQVPAIPGDDRKTALYRLEILMKAGIADDANRIAREALALDLTSDAAIELLGRTARRNATSEVMIPICQAAMKQRTGHVQARYELAVAYAHLGRSDEARQLIDLDRFVTVTSVAVPGEYVRAETFEEALSGEIARNPTLRPDPIGKATRRGLQTSGDLAFGSGGAMGALIDLIRSAVEAYVAALPDGSDDPFVAACPEKAGLDAWAVVYPGEGYQERHIHSAGWLSGIYYVSVPEIAGSDARAGCLALGSLNLPEAREPPWGVRNIRPAPGQLIMFPSFIPHATIPTRSPGSRICVAFDVIPLQAGPALLD